MAFVLLHPFYSVIRALLFVGFLAAGCVNGQHMTKLSAGGAFNVVVDRHNEAWAHGSNYNGELGAGYDQPNHPVKVYGLTDIKAVASGEAHTVALLTDGTVWCWGHNVYYQLGADSWDEYGWYPMQAYQLDSVETIAAGAHHSLAVKSDGTVWAWGRNDSSQLGIGSSSYVYVPTQVVGINGVSDIAGGAKHSLAVKADGSVWSWGDDSRGQLGLNLGSFDVPMEITSLSGFVAVAAGAGHSLALKADGTVWAWGANESGQLGDGSLVDQYDPVEITELDNVVAIAAGEKFSVALKSDGTLWAWGSNESGQLGVSATTAAIRAIPAQIGTIANILAIACGNKHIVALASNGMLWTWGNNEYWGRGVSPVGPFLAVNGQDSYVPIEVSALSNVGSISARGLTSFAVKNNGVAMMLGGDEIFGEHPHAILGGAELLEVNGSFKHALALKSDGDVLAWGDNYYGQLGNGANIYSDSPVQVSNLSDVIKIATSRNNSAALRADGKIWAWGSNSEGQLGNNSNPPSNVPVLVANLSNNVSVALGDDFSMALKSDGTVWTWGRNAGQLPSSYPSANRLPIQIAGLTDVVEIAASENGHCLALKSDGTVSAWGSNIYGQLGLGHRFNVTTPSEVIGLTGVIAISAGYYHSMALKSDGTLWTWGGNNSGELGRDGALYFDVLPTKVEGLSGVMGISAGPQHSMVIKEDGTIAAWGSASEGRIGEGVSTRGVRYLPARAFEAVEMLHSASQLSLAIVGNVEVSPLGQTRELSVTVNAGDNPVEKVDLYHYGVLVGTDDAAPYAFTYSPTTWGKFPLFAVAVETNGYVSSKSNYAVINVPYDSESPNGDGLPDWWEIKHFGNLNASFSGDDDNDGLTNAQEFEHGTNPLAIDTDGDGVDDAKEIEEGSDPRDPANSSKLAQLYIYTRLE